MSPAETAPETYQAFPEADAAIRKGPLDATLRELVKMRASRLNGCLSPSVRQGFPYSRVMKKWLAHLLRSRPARTPRNMVAPWPTA
ncbi:carboxymuconolactone decarboxylase family protein [Streptomyces chiangmaiensis]|uniref:Carboxymuconolactone decarboxylase family protein n=1 Tax=Streptomyces chiangmaiensis TaxID=766497 RepID=A0ABU7FSU0_9ACTN|nr:carboxymuconolactone decarboxylase family protein [Streptomyces chiangmaiensis]MED7827171.1 carboxymuconolactone decarboxylase family protein [Streptomyces chiangmaiensis]